VIPTWLKNFRFLTGKSLKATLFKNFIVLSMGLIFLTTLLLGVNEFISQKEALDSDLKIWGGFLSSSMQVSLAYDDKEEAARILKNLQSEKRIKGITLVNLDMDVFYQHGTERDLEFVRNLHKRVNIDQEYIEVEENGVSFLLRPIKYKDDLYGWVAIEINMDFFYKKLHKYLYLAISLILSFFVISWFLSRKAQVFVLKPLDEFSAEIERLHDGVLNGLDVEKHNIFWDLKEVDSLYHRFQSLFDLIELRNKEIREHNENLEKTVEARTRELDEERQKSAHSAKLVAMGQLASNISHEINNPLAIIKMCLRFVTKKLKKLEVEDPKITSNLENATNTVTRISGLVGNLKLLAIDSSQAEYEPTTLTDIIENLNSLIDMNPKKHLVDEIKYNLPEEEIHLHCKPPQIVQVLHSLITNSLESIEKKEIDAAMAEIKLNAEINSGLLEFSIVDNGVGVAKEIRPEIFKPFFTTKDSGQGTGLGLSMASTMIKGHEQQITFKSNSKETIFSFCINLADPESQVFDLDDAA
jgi:C4-dicarboxylate-specific signal transduction histidine kinase